MAAIAELAGDLTEANVATWLDIVVDRLDGAFHPDVPAESQRPGLPVAEADNLDRGLGRIFREYDGDDYRLAREALTRWAERNGRDLPEQLA